MSQNRRGWSCDLIPCPPKSEGKRGGSARNSRNLRKLTSELIRNTSSGLSARNSSDLGLRANPQSPTTKEERTLEVDDVSEASKVKDSLVANEDQSDSDAEALEELIRDTVTIDTQVQGIEVSHGNDKSDDPTEFVPDPAPIGPESPRPGHGDLPDPNLPPHYKLKDHEILPFLRSDDSPDTAKSGGYGNVFKVRLHPDHWNDSYYRALSFKSFKKAGEQFFAVKELRSNPDSDRAFARERFALTRARKSGLGTGHLVDLIASFDHRGSRYLLFPWAESNLLEFWKRKSPDPRDQDTIKWIILQCLGISEALSGVHSFGVSSLDGHNKREFGRHGDIKPENILWYRDARSTGASTASGDLRLADFGLAELNYKARRPQRLAGTPTYRAPECDVPTGDITARWDIWSLGCLYLEFVIWLLEGFEGLDNFQRFRTQALFLSQTQDLDIPDDSFFSVTSSGDTRDGGLTYRTQLRPSVLNQITRLRKHRYCFGPIFDLLNVIEHGMLLPVPEQRLDAHTCVSFLNDIYQKSLRNPYYGVSQTLLMAVPHVQSFSDLSFIIDTEDGHLRAVSWFECFRIWLNQRAETGIDWWPLPQAIQPLSQGHSRLSWTYGGKPMSIILDADEAKRWHEGRWSVGSNSTILPTFRPSKSIASTATTPSTSPDATTRSRLSSIVSCLSRKSTFGSKGAAGHQRAPQAPSCWKEAYLCVDRCWTSAKETQLSTLVAVDTMADDYALFNEARRVLSCAQGNRAQRFFSWRSYTYLNLTQFHFLFHSSDRVKTFDYASLHKPPDICQGYEYTSQHPEVDVHMRIMAEIILQGIRHPELGRGERTVLSGIPKLTAPPGLKKEAYISGWGFHAGQGPCLAKIISWFSVLVVLGLAFVPAWLASIDKVDLQNAFAPVSFMMTLVGALIAMCCLIQGGA